MVKNKKHYKEHYIFALPFMQRIIFLYIGAYIYKFIHLKKLSRYKLNAGHTTYT